MMHMKPIRAWLSRALTTALALALLLTGLSPGALAAGVPPDDSPPGSAEEVSAAALYASGIPAEMLNGPLVRAMSYIGFDIQWLKDNQKLYDYYYTGSRTQQNAPWVLTGIRYSDTGAGTGLNTRADSSTPTGKAPDIAAFHSTGMDCGDFIAYYYGNYLKNIEGYDVSLLQNALSQVGGYRMDDSIGLEKACKKLAEEGKIRSYTYPLAEVQDGTADLDTMYKTLKIGTLVQFANNSYGIAHWGVYAGTYNGYHFMFHVGNDRGPELTCIEFMASTTGSKRSWPVSFYEFTFEFQDGGFIKVIKKDQKSNPLAGAEFEAVDTVTGAKYPIGPTNDSGYAISYQIPYGRYTVTETVAPAGCTLSDASWLVTLNDSTPNREVTLEITNNKPTGALEISKYTTDHASLAGWWFRIKDNAGATVDTRRTDENGKILLPALEPGVYTVEEIIIRDGYVCGSLNPQAVTITAAGKSFLFFSNSPVDTTPGSVTVHKTDENGSPLAGASFRLQWSTDGRTWQDAVYRAPYKTVSNTYATITYPNTSGFNVRSGPGTSYGAVGKVYQGDRLEVLETHAAGDDLWGRIGDDRWIWLDPGSVTWETVTEAPETDRVLKTVARLSYTMNVRDGLSTSAAPPLSRWYEIRKRGEQNGLRNRPPQDHLVLYDIRRVGRSAIFILGRSLH